MKPIIHSNSVSKKLLALNAIMAIVYLSWWFMPGHVGHPVLYGLLLFGEVYHVFMALSFWYTVWPSKVHNKPVNPKLGMFAPSVDVFITVAGEPVDVVRKTAEAARDMNYGNHKVYILNDGYVAKKDNWKEIEKLANDVGISCITRRIPGGAKAGNINNALRKTSGDIVVIFDADMVAHGDFLQKMIPYFKDSKVGFAQSPQYYQNFPLNDITEASWKQQEFFFGPIMMGKEKSNAAFICGTNVAIRRTALTEVGGMNEDNIAEDFLTSLAIHQKGWVSYYVPEVLVEGLAPEDLLSYFKQQLRWARGSLEVLFGSNPLFKGGLTWAQKIEYLASALYYFNGFVVLIDILMPLLFLYFGMVPVASTTTSFALFFVPFMFLNLYTLSIVSRSSMTFQAISFSQSSWTLQLLALKSVLLRQKTAFSVTPKTAQSGNFLFLAYPHLVYALVAIVGIFFAVDREGMTPAVTTNIAWAMFNVLLFGPFISAASGQKTMAEIEELKIQSEKIKVVGR